MASIELRDLKDQIAVCIGKVRGGERVTVTENGAAVAELVPAPAEGAEPSGLDVLTARGEARGPVRPRTRKPLPQMKPILKGVTSQQLLDEIREESDFLSQSKSS